MNTLLRRWNELGPDEAARIILPCCGSTDWALEVTGEKPFAAEDALYAASDAVWWGLPEAAWREAFDSHPRIGQTYAQKEATAVSLRWSATEQQAATNADEAAQQALAEANRVYEEKFGRIFIVCASGRTSAEILARLEVRLHSDPATELRESAEQQRQITQLRLRRWLEV